MIPAQIQEMYPDMERRLLPVIEATIKRKGAGRLDGIDIDDAIQEARMALLSAMVKYDFTKADLAPYMNRVVINTCNALYHKTVQRRRTPRVPVRDLHGEWKMVPSHPASLEQLTESGEEVTPKSRIATDSELCQEDSERRVRAVERAMFRCLEARERRVLRCRLDPPEGLLAIAGGEEPTNVHIAQYLGIGKAQIDWALYKIRNVFTEVASQERFSDVFAEFVESSRWPTIHISFGTDFHNEFVQRKFRQHDFRGDQPLSHRDEECLVGRRRVVQYEWGAEVAVWLGGRCWTAVVRGRFNPRSGEITGQSGARKLLPVPGYPQLAKALADERRDAMSSDELKILPSCVGGYEQGDDVCDGEGNGQYCVHRDNCLALQLWMKDKSTKVGKYTHARVDENDEPYRVPKNIARLSKIVATVKKRYGIKDGAVTRKGKASPKGAAKSAQKRRRAANGAPGIRARSEAAIALDSWYDRWVQIVLEETGCELCDGDNPQPGQLFTKDRRVKSGYVGLYYKPKSGRSIGIGLVMWKPRNRTMDLKFPLEPGDFVKVSKESMKKLKPQEHNDGVFTSISRGLDEKGLCLGGEVLAKLINDGTIGLPEAR